MEKQYRINWKKGLNITPEIMTSSDNYHVAERNLLGAFIASRLYGILQDSKFYVEKEINNNYLIINKLSCYAITSEGAIISIPKEMNFKKELLLSEINGDEFYVVLSVNPSNIIPEDENALHIFPDYYLSVQRTSETIMYGIPILKLTNNGYWEIDRNYIPPSVSLCSSDILLQKYFDVKNLIHKIIEMIPNSDTDQLLLKFLKFELNEFTQKKSPEDWLLLMKKYCWIFYSHLLNENKIDETSNVMRFFEEKYNPNEIGKSLQLGYDCFDMIYTILNTKPVEEVPEFEIKL